MNSLKTPIVDVMANMEEKFLILEYSRFQDAFVSVRNSESSFII